MPFWSTTIPFVPGQTKFGRAELSAWLVDAVLEPELLPLPVDDPAPEPVPVVVLVAVREVSKLALPKELEETEEVDDGSATNLL